MKFGVVWSRHAQDRLTEIWVNSADRAAVTSAADRIDIVLARDPSRHARLQENGLYELEIAPLVILFSLSEMDLRVTIEDIIELGPLEP